MKRSPHFTFTLLLLLGATTYTYYWYRPKSATVVDERTLDTYLTVSQVAEMKALAGKGSADAAHRLWTYYAFHKHDRDEAEEWLQRAAKLGNENATSFLETRH